MDILFTTNVKFWSKVFRFLFSEPVSHIVLNFNLDSENLIAEISTNGGAIKPLEKFKAKNKVLFTISLESDPSLEKRLYERIEKIIDFEYDFSAYAFGLARGLLWKIFKLPYPKNNRYSKPLKFACTEIFLFIDDILKDEYNISFDEIDLSSHTPFMLYNFLKEYEYDESNDEPK